MSTVPATADATSDLGRADRSSNGSAPAGTKRPPLRPTDRRLAGRFVRVARAGDTIIAVVVLLGAFLVATFRGMPVGLEEFLAIRLTMTNLLLVVGYIVVWRLVCTVAGLYDPNTTGDQRAQVLRVVIAVTAGSAVALIFPLISVTRTFSHLAVLYFWIGSIVSMLLLRMVLRTLINPSSPRVHDVLIVGSGPRALSLYHDLTREGETGHRFLGFVDSSRGDLAPEVRSRLLGDLAGLEQLLMRRPVDEVYIALPVRSHYAEIQRAIEICEQGGVRARYLADVFEHRRSGEQQLSAVRLSSIPTGVSPDDSRLIVKRCVDIAVAGIALVAVSPVLLIAALAMKLTSPGPIIFSQDRYGLNKRLFKMFKLRTMVVDAEAQQALLETLNEASGPVFKIREDPRITPVGRVLRRLSIDELPQLLNVIRGEMSLVGPRPLPTRDVIRFSEPALMRRFSVCPGITGLWQVSGRSDVEFDHWIKLDLQYIDDWSLALDLRILLRTVPTVLQGRGAV